MPKVSVIVLNWNGQKFLKDCLNSLFKVNYKELEIIVVDNHSTDSSVQFVRKNYPKAKIIENKDNFGFAKGNNVGFSKARGEYVLILNNDTIVTPDFLDFLIKDFEEDGKIACIQPQIRIMENKNILDGVGGFLTGTGFLYHFGYLKSINEEKYKQKMEIFSAKGACILLKRKIVEKTGLFDEDFFIFFEETDLCYRLWLAGFIVIYEPRSIIYHVGGGDTTSSNSYQYERRMYLSFRNMIASYLKNFGSYNMITIFPIFIVLFFILSIYYLLTLRFNLTKIVYKAFWWNILNINKTLEKRKIIQEDIRKVTDENLNKRIIKNPRISYYYYQFSGNLKNYEQ